MTVFEFFKNQYDKHHDIFVKCINPEIPVDSFEFVKIASNYWFGGTVHVDPWFNIIGTEDTKEMFEAGYLKKWEESNWMARQTGTSRHVALNAKGLKAFYKAMF